jgi:asparagine synthase (glutamine-hydrolysing)
MCGFAGVFDTRDRRPQSRDILERMNQVIFHRGPDAGGYHEEPGLGLAHRRLSIIDLSGGSQPLYSEDKSVVGSQRRDRNFQGLVDGCPLSARLPRPDATRGDRPRLGAVGNAASSVPWDVTFALWDRTPKRSFSRDRLGVKVTPRFPTIALFGRS